LKTSPALTNALGLGLGLGYAGADVLFDGNDIYGFTAFVFKAHKIIASSHLMEQVNWTANALHIGMTTIYFSIII
jgi:hypothetical protein